MILEELDKLIEVEKRHQRQFQDKGKNVLFWEAKGAVRAFEQAKKQLKESPLVKLIALKAVEPHICYSLKESKWVVSFNVQQDEDTLIHGSDEYMGEAIRKALKALTDHGKGPEGSATLN